MSQPRYLTKSRFKLAMECPTKLFYTGKPEYANDTLDDPFLAALADGGYQVGKLAQCYFPGGIEITSRDYDRSVAETAELLEREEVTIFEAAFRFENLFIRADVVRKVGDSIELIEVKAKSCDFSDETGCHNKNGTISATWLPYIYDIAFQKYVVEHAYPQFKVTAHLMLADRTALAGTDGLNQKFRLITGDNGRRSVEVSTEINEADLATLLMRKVCVEASCEKVYSSIDFEKYVGTLAEHYANDSKITPKPSSICKECEFHSEDGALRSGFHECWTETFAWQPNDFEDATVLELWTFGRKDELIDAGKLKLNALTPDDIAPKTKPKGEPKVGLSTTDRQWVQIRKAVDRDNSHFIDGDGIRAEMALWRYPLHFIDFETVAPVVPFQRGRRPYEGIAFQFSHHVAHEDGRIEHRGEYLHTEVGTFPSYAFLRELKRELETDNGTVFRYHSHENSYLCMIREQLLRDESDIPDRDGLVSFVETIARPRGKNPGDGWEEGPRCMVDLYELVKRYYYHPSTRGSISLKFVLPAVLGASDYLQGKYSQPIYGAVGGIRSLNFNDWTWVMFDESHSGEIRNPVDPYKLLPKLFTDETERDYDIIFQQDRISDGGAAMTAYGKLQYQQMSPTERSAIESSLKKYCELDTLAMVMIYEAWREWLK
ncbi:MAG TPA: DUF2779 domain-containing protein [Pyrinomonadaceae bacterium]|nr:DUF2779 domain-containing protein [Pyrinomonadaceae bacterium]